MQQPLHYFFFKKLNMDFLLNIMNQQGKGQGTVLSGLGIHLLLNITLHGIQKAKILGSDTGSSDAYSLMFQRVVVSKGTSSPRFLGCMNLQIKELKPFEMSKTICPTTQHHTLEVLNLQPCHCQEVQAQVLSHHLLTMNVLQFLSRPYGIYGGQYGNVQVSVTALQFSPVNNNSTMLIYYQGTAQYIHFRLQYQGSYPISKYKFISNREH